MNYDSGTSLGDILNAALRSRNDFNMLEITLHRPGGARGPFGQDRKINDIKALREATRVRDGGTFDNWGHGEWPRYTGTAMTLIAAKDAIEAMYAHGTVRLRMTPDSYGRFMVNRHDLPSHAYDWQVKSSRYVEVKREVPIFNV